MEELKVKLSKSVLKRIIKEEMEIILQEQGDYGFKDPECLKQVKRVQSDGHFPLKDVTFWDAKGIAVYVFQRNDETLKPEWHNLEKSTANTKELLAIAMQCLKNKCARGSTIKVKSDKRITLISQVEVLTKEDFEEAFFTCGV